MYFEYIFPIVSYLCLNYAHNYLLADVVTPLTDNTWDILILSQVWPSTACKNWTHNEPDHHCVYPNNTNWWTLHGIWPIKWGNINEPSYCNKTWAFDREQIEPIEEQLQNAWTNVHKETELYSFWAHEWEKHGTCATSLQAFDSQYQYFNRGIEWNREYPIFDFLSSAEILPSDTTNVTIENLTKAVMSKTKKLPTIVCLVLDNVQYLEEIRICFNKQLDVIDCETAVFYTCNGSHNAIIYPTITKTFLSAQH